MKAVRKISVRLNLQRKLIDVGELIADGRKIHFRYLPEFIANGFELSPLKLPLKEKIFTAAPEPFSGLFGLFADSLPDGWGRLLLDRSLAERGLAMEDITPLQQLAITGKRGMGALEYHPQYDHPYKEVEIDLDKLSEQSLFILEGNAATAIENLYALAGSSGGARPKILTGYHPKKKLLCADDDILPAGYEHWIVKFRATIDKIDAAETEYAYYLMANAAGIHMSKSGLIKGASGKKYFATKRFDRNEKGKLHLHSLAGVTHDNFRMSSLDYGHIMDCAFRLTHDVREQEKVFRLAAFNIYAHNRDDHSRNFSFLFDIEHGWRGAPAYDLTFSSSAHGMHSIAIAGEYRNPGREHLLSLAKTFGIKKHLLIIDEVKQAVSEWKKFAQKAGVSKTTTSVIAKRTAELLSH
jgi:serine/threonine-protein kinase HipA